MVYFIPAVTYYGDISMENVYRKNYITADEVKYGNSCTFQSLFNDTL